MIDRAICPHAKRRDASTAERFRTFVAAGALVVRAVVPTAHHERSLHAAATCTIRDVTIRSPVVGNQPFRVYPWPSICRGANVNPAAVERHVHCYYYGARGGSANKTIVGVATVPPSLVNCRNVSGHVVGPNYYYRIYVWLRVIGIAHQRHCKGSRT